DEAERACVAAGRIGQGVGIRGFHAVLCAELALTRGDLTESGRQLSAARGYFGSQDRAPQHDLPLTRLADALAAGEGRLPDARA
ncbi:hypothetical protein ACKI19_45200, partial [Streptomyces caniscabiei]|uniref:hypothetical protein n=1 Tax=Streptomyces caniscabiei TaxID=2746961 RepID=UPI0038F7742D